MRPIDGDELLQTVSIIAVFGNDVDVMKCGELRKILEMIKNAPTIEVPQRMRGKWREYNFPGEEHVYCTNCKEEYYVDDLLMGRNDYPNFCPNCGSYNGVEIACGKTGGADMRGKE